VLAGVVEVEIHLTRVSVREGTKFEIQQQQRSQGPMEEDQVNGVPDVVDPQPPLSADEAKVIAQFQQERLHVTDDGFFQVTLAVLGLEIEEL
jgi:hypothetical protein